MTDQTVKSVAVALRIARDVAAELEANDAHAEAYANVWFDAGKDDVASTEDSLRIYLRRRLKTPERERNMNEEQTMTTVRIGEPVKLKEHSLKQIEECLTAALAKLTGERIVVSVNNFRIMDHTPSTESSVHFDVSVVRGSQRVPAPF